MSETKKLSTREVADKLKIDPKRLRAMLREMRGKSPGERYELTAHDVEKLSAALKEQRESKQKSEKKASTKKPAKDDEHGAVIVLRKPAVKKAA